MSYLFSPDCDTDLNDAPSWVSVTPNAFQPFYQPLAVTLGILDVFPSMNPLSFKVILSHSLSFTRSPYHSLSLSLSYSIPTYSCQIDIFTISQFLLLLSISLSLHLTLNFLLHAYPFLSQPTPASLNNTLYTYIFLSPSHFNATYITCGFSFGPFIVDADGVMLGPNTTSYSTRNVTCLHDEFDILTSDISNLMQSISNITWKSYDFTFAQLLQLDVIRYDDAWSACERQMDQYLDILPGVTPINIPSATYCGSIGSEWANDVCCNGTMCCPLVTVNLSVPVYSNFTSKVGKR